MWQPRSAMRVNAMLTRYLLAPLRCLAYVALAALGFLAFMLWIVAAMTIVAYHPAVRLVRWLARLHRTLAERWTGVTIPTGARAVPEPPRRDDGWYVHGNQVFRRRWFPAYLLEMEKLGEDTVLLRETYWLFFG